MGGEGIANLEAVIGRLEQAIAEAREVTAEAHSTIKALRAASREATEMTLTVERAAKAGVDERMAEAISAGLEEFKEAYSEAIGRQVNRITDLFERRANLCMYGNEQGKGVNIFDAMRDFMYAAKAQVEIDPRLPSLHRRAPGPRVEET